MNDLKIEPIKKEVLVEASQETAFRIFTEKMDAWWPRSHHVGSSPMIAFVLEPKANGRWYTCHEDGSEVNVGYVLGWNPYSHLLLNWQINGEYKCDPELTTEVEVRFIPEGPKYTRVKFEHRNLERMRGVKALAEMNEGWGIILELYKNFINNAL